MGFADAFALPAVLRVDYADAEALPSDLSRGGGESWSVGWGGETPMRVDFADAFAQPAILRVDFADAFALPSDPPRENYV